MKVTLLVHLEAAVVDDEKSFVWWAESPELTGFTAAADHLPDLLQQCDDAIPDVIRELGLDDDGPLEIVPSLSRLDQGTAGTTNEEREPDVARVLVNAAA